MITKTELLLGVTVSTVTYLIFNHFNKSNKLKKSSYVLKGGYQVPAGTKNMGDALHAFEKRKSDGFGGLMSTKIKAALRDLHKKGINSDVTQLLIKVDSKNYKVEWEVTIEPSKDGKAYVGFATVGSTGKNADSRAENQIDTMKNWSANAKDYTLVLDFKNPTGNYIRQFFYKYTLPIEYPPY